MRTIRTARTTRTARTARWPAPTPRRAGTVLVAGLLLLAACGADSADETRDASSDEGSASPDMDSAAPDAAEAPTGAGADAIPPPQDPGPAGRFEDHGINPDVDTANEPRSTFGLDVGSGSYAIARSYLLNNQMPDPEGVRTEEFVNYFDQDYDAPEDGLGLHLDGTDAPFLDDDERRLLRVGVQAADLSDEHRRPATLTFVVDQSGSMAGDNLDMVQHALHQLVNSLESDEEVAIVTYSDDAELTLDATPVEDDDTIRSAIDDLSSDGGTNTEAGLLLGYETARDNLRDDRTNRVILLSDGVANVGETRPDVLADHASELGGRDIQLITVGVGMEMFNDALLEQLADEGNGFYAFVDSPQEAERLFVDDLTGSLESVALDARIQVTFDPEMVTSYRLLGYENRQLDDEDFRDEDTDGGEIGAGHTATAIYDVALSDAALSATESSGTSDAELAEVEVLWHDPDTDEVRERAASLNAAEVTNDFADAPTRLRQTVVVAAFADVLRGGPWSEHVTLTGVANNAAPLADELDDEAVTELVELTGIAAEL